MRRRAAFFPVFVSSLWVLSLVPVAAGEPEAGSPPKTVITGDRMNLLRKGEAVEFLGGVKLARGSDRMTADRMVSDEKRGLTQAWGRVYLRRDVPTEGVRWEAWADEGRYHSPSSSGTLWGRKGSVRLRRSVLTEGEGDKPLEMEADRITFFDAALVPAVEGSSRPAASPAGTGQRAEAEGRVHVLLREFLPEPRETEIWAGRAFFDGSGQSIRFWEGYDSRKDFPRARQTEGDEVRDLSGMNIVYFLQDKRLLVENNVRALIRTPEVEKKKDGLAR